MKRLMIMVLTTVMVGQLAAFAGTIGEGLNCPELTWGTGGTPSVSGENVNWSYTEDDSHGDGACVTSGVGGAGDAISWLATEVSGPCKISFWYKVQTYHGSFIVYSDNTILYNYSGDTGVSPSWQFAEYEIPSGNHEIKLQYHHPGMGFAYEFNGVRVDNFTVTSDDSKPEGGPYKEIVDGIEWTFMVDANLNASVGTGEYEGWAVPQTTEGAIVIPTKLGGRTVTSIGDWAFLECRGLTSVTIPSGIHNIGAYAYCSCVGITNVLISEGVTTIGADAFLGCEALTSIAIPSSVTSIGNCAFFGCTGLRSVTMSEGVESIGGGAFTLCIGLTSVTIPSSVTSIGDGAFSACDGLSAINVHPDNATYSSQDGVLFNKDKTVLLRCPAEKQGACVVLAVVTSIGQGAFEGYGRPLDFEGAPPEGIENAGINQDVTICYNVAYEAQWLPVIEECGWTNATPYTPGGPRPAGGPYVEVMGEVAWTFMVDANLNASVGTGDYKGQAIPQSTEGAIVIPTKLGGRTVMSIGGYAFFDCGSLTNVTIPSSVTSIGDWAFCSCSLTSMTIPSSVTSIGNNAFCRCFGLTSVAIPSGVTSIGDRAFSGCAGLRSVTISEGVTSIGDGAFNNCFRLTSVTMSEGVKSIGDGAFYWCEALTSIAISSSVTSIGNGAFSKCYGLSAINVHPDNAAYSSQDGILYNKDKTALLLWPCGKQGACVVSSVVTSIEQGAFSECGGLSEIVVDPDNATYSSQDGILFNKDKTALLRCPAGKQGACVVSAVVTSIGQGAFEGYGRPLDFEGAPPEGIENAGIKQDATICYNVAYETQWLPVIEQCGWTNAKPYTPGEPRPAGGPYVEVVDGVAWTFMVDTNFNASVGTGGYRGRAIPQSTEGAIVIPTKLGGRTVTSIGDVAFSECFGLTSMTIPSSVTSIGAYAFYACTGLLSVTIPSSVTNVGECAFLECFGLTSVTIPSSITSVGWGVFQSCTGLVSVTMSEGMTFIGDGMFFECTSLMNVTIPSSVTSVGESAFQECVDLTNVTIPLGVTSIGQQAFCCCTNLTSVTIPSSVTSIGAYAFSECGGLQSIEVDAGNAYYSSQDGVLFDKDKITLLQYAGGKKGAYTIPSSVTSIGDCAFDYCFGLTSVTISEGVTSIGYAAFWGCSSLTSVTLCSSVESIGSCVFEDCVNLNAVDFEGAPPDGVANARIKQDAAIRYNVAYETQWLPVIEQCGWTNATPYDPFPSMPVISPESGTTFEGSSLSVSMTCASEGATIHYTTDGSEPTMESPAYRRFKVYGKTTVKAIAFYEDGKASEMAVAEYARGVCEEPTVTPLDGTMFEHSGQVVSLAHENPEGVLRYTTDGNDPTPESPEYTDPFTIDETTVVKAKVFGDQYFDSGVVTATLTRVWVKVATPVITAPTSFTGSQQKVEIACATEGATVRYTTNGQDPNSHSPKYTKPFYVTDSTMVKAYATKTDYTKSDIAACTVAKVWAIGDTMGKPDHTFETSGDLGFVRVADETATLGESMQSGEIKNSQTSILSTVVVGPGTLTFKWKTSCEHDPEGAFEWDHAEFWVDGKIKGQLDDETEWIEVSQRIEGDCEHTVIWRYVKDDVEEGGADCLWVSDYVWETDYTETKTTEVPVPYDWLQEKSRDIVDEYDNYEKVAKQKAYNPRYTVEQCYVAGLDPESTTNEFKMAISMEGGFPTVTWDPDLGVLREYKIWGRESLMSGDWQYPTNSLHRFFKVSVEMP